MGKFLDTSRSIFEGRQKLHFENSFKNVFAWIDAFQQTSSRTQLDFKNLEDVFSLLAMARELGDKDAIALYDQFTEVMFETLETEIQIGPIGGNEWVDSAYLHFANGINSSNDMREAECRPGTFKRDAIISFNYDFLLDAALGHRSIAFSYGMKEVAVKEFGYYKLHGSMNWAYHPDCSGGRHIQVFNPGDAIKKGELTGEVRRTALYAELVKAKCRNSGCSYASVLKPVFIPPTWAKSPLGGEIQAMWNRAVLEVSEAEQLIVIGYSLPRTDTFFRYLLALGLKNNTRLRRVLLVNSGLDERLLDAYRELFSENVDVRPVDPSNAKLTFTAFAHSNIHARVSSL